MLHLTLYRLLTWLLAPFLVAVAVVRLLCGKERFVRIRERFGVASRGRPEGKLIWCHAASVGELHAALTMIRTIDALPDIRISWVVTTGTVTSADLFAARASRHHIHQFLPWDFESTLSRFLDHWTPDAVLWLESEIWPVALFSIRKRKLPAALINARLSHRSYLRWRKCPKIFQSLMHTFPLILTGSKDDQERFRKLGVASDCYGNLKEGREPEPEQAEVAHQIQAILQGRCCWIAASIHPDEFQQICEAHKHITPVAPTLLIAVPRHPERAEAFAHAAADQGLTTCKLSTLNARLTQKPRPEPPKCSSLECLIIDCIGIMDTVYRQSPVVFMGGSFCAHGGQNPLEAACLESAILHGPHVGNFTNIYANLEATGGAKRVVSAIELADTIVTLNTDGNTVLAEMIAASTAFAQRGRGVTTRYVEALQVLSPVLRPSSPPMDRQT